MEKLNFQITADSHWFWWELYIQQEFDLDMELKGLKHQINSHNQYLENFDHETNQMVEKYKILPQNVQSSNNMEDFEIEQSYSKSFLTSFSLDSNCLIIFSYLETKLLKLCLFLEQEFNINKKVNNVRARNTLEKYWIFLETHVELNLTDLKCKYDHLSSQRLIRNSIAHQGNGIIKGQVTNAPGMESTNKTYLIKDISYHIHLLETTEVLLKGVLKAIAMKKYELRE